MEKAETSVFKPKLKGRLIFGTASVVFLICVRFQKGKVQTGLGAVPVGRFPSEIKNAGD